MRLVAIAVAALLLGCSGSEVGRRAHGSGSPPDAGAETDTREEPPDDDVTVATLNVLHGLFCDDGDRCRQRERLDLAFRWIEAIGCPDVVALQEIIPDHEAVIREEAGTACPFGYEVAYERYRGFDDSVVLSRYPISERSVVPLFGSFRFAQIVRIDHGTGPVLVFSTHLASGSDHGGDPCGPDCPAECVAAGAVRNRDCQAVQLAAEAAARADGGSGGPTFVVGDLNAEPTSFVHDRLVAAGLLDAYTRAGGVECGLAGSAGCTSGRSDDLAGLESRDSGQDARIDYVFVAPAGACDRLDRTGDVDGDGTPTDVFSSVPNPFAPACGPAPDAICWPSDHDGVVADLNCR